MILDKIFWLVYGPERVGEVSKDIVAYRRGLCKSRFTNRAGCGRIKKKSIRRFL